VTEQQQTEAAAAEQEAKRRQLLEAKQHADAAAATNGEIDRLLVTLREQFERRAKVARRPISMKVVISEGFICAFVALRWPGAKRAVGLISGFARPFLSGKRGDATVNTFFFGLGMLGTASCGLPTKFEMILNLRTAKALGLAVPPSISAARRRGDRISAGYVGLCPKRSLPIIGSKSPPAR
jgi:hypothetical protein